MIPAAVVGIFFNDIIESLFDGQLILVGFMLIITGILLFLQIEQNQLIILLVLFKVSL